MASKTELEAQVAELTEKLETAESDRKAGWTELDAVLVHVTGEEADEGMMANDVIEAVEDKFRPMRTALSQAEGRLKELAADKTALEGQLAAKPAAPQAPVSEAPASFTLGQVSDECAREEIRDLRAKLVAMTGERDAFATEVVALKR